MKVILMGVGAALKSGGREWELSAFLLAYDAVFLGNEDVVNCVKI